MFIIRNIPEQKYFADIKYVTVNADSPDLGDPNWNWVNVRASGQTLKR